MKCSNAKVIFLATSITAGVVVPIAFYTSLALGSSQHSDAASAVLMAADMLKGNWLLKGWYLSTNSYYLTDLLFHLPLVLVLGINPLVMAVVPALLYTLVVGMVLLIVRRATTELADQMERYSRLAVAFSLVAIPGIFASHMTLVFTHPYGHPVFAARGYLPAYGIA